MSRLEEKSNNEILLEIKQLQVEHENLKLSLVKDYDTIEALKVKMKKDFAKLEDIESRFNEDNAIIVKRLKGEV